MIVFDLEATDLMRADVSPLETQPRIIEFAAIKLDDDSLREKDRLGFLVNPGIPIPEEAVQITKITDKMVAREKPFVAWYPELINFFLGERTLVAHNAPYDTAVLQCELNRIGRQFRFPWPPHQKCTVELTQHMTGKFMKLAALYEYAFGKPPKEKQLHRAMDDVEILVEIVKWLRTKKIL